MYTLSVPFKDLHGKPRNATLEFNLFEREVVKLLREFQHVFKQGEAWKAEADLRELDAAEITEYFDNFEEIVLSSYGKSSPDGLSFDKSIRFGFEDTAVFNALMMMFVTDTDALLKFLTGVMPEGMEDLVKKADESMIARIESTKDEDTKAALEALRREMEELRGQQSN